MSFGGFAFEWMLSRSWIKILIRTLPLFALVALIIVVWFGGQIDKSRLADRYMELGSPEIAKWEERLFDKLSAKPQVNQPPAANPESGDSSPPAAGNSEAVASQNGTDQGDRSGQAQAAADGNQVAADGNQVAADANPLKDVQVPAFEEMLFRRVELLRPSAQSRFVIGTGLLLKGAVTDAQKVLRKIAPDPGGKEGAAGSEKAHAIMALSYLNQYVRSKDQTLLPLLKHHADRVVEWPKTPKDIVMVAADLNWQSGNREKSFDILKKSAERFPELYPVILERANAVLADPRLAESSRAIIRELAESARSKAIIHFEGLLKEDPKNSMTRIQIAQLMGTSDEALERVERLLDEGLKLGESPELVRALSEVYRIRYVKHLTATQGKTDDFSLLMKAFEIDKKNPLISEQVARLVRDSVRPPRVLQESLRDMLSSGEATVSTHAIMSEFYLAANRQSEAILHLEKVFQAAPTEVKYANNLAYLYAEAGRTEEAQQVAKKCLELIQRTNLQNQRFVDELLDTLGMIYHKLEKNSDAISSYELALRLNDQRIDTRQKLVAIYRGLGMEEIAAAHENEIEKIKKAQQERAESARAATSENSPQATTQPAANQQPEAPQPSGEQPATDEPATDEPATDEPATDEPAAEQPAAG